MASRATALLAGGEMGGYSGCWGRRGELVGEVRGVGGVWGMLCRVRDGEATRMGRLIGAL